MPPPLAPATPSAPITTASITTGPTTTTCAANFVVSGGWEREVSGEVPGAPRRIGNNGQGVSLDVWFELPQGDKATDFLFSVFDVDGPTAPEPVQALFGETSPLPQAHGWYPGLDPGHAALADDGSRADFDLELGRIGVGPGGHVVGSITCPPLS